MDANVDGGLMPVAIVILLQDDRSEARVVPVSRHEWEPALPQKVIDDTQDVRV
jgi:hypothetical protein